MLIERNRVTRAAFNCRMKLCYHYKMYRKSKGDPAKRAKYVEYIDKYEADESKLTDEKYAFTEKTHKRRMELCKELKTVEYSRADNRVMNIRLDGIYYALEDIELEVKRYKLDQEINNILLK